MGRNALERERGQIIVATRHGALSLLANGDAGDPSLVAQDLLDLGVRDVLHAARFEIGAPGIDPDEIGRPVEHAVGRSGDRI